MKVIKVEVEVNDEMSEQDVQQIVEEKIKAHASHKFKKRLTIFSTFILTISLVVDFATSYDGGSFGYMIVGIFGAIVLNFMGLDTIELIKMRKK